MTPQENPSFNDPALKKHCCAIWSSECAPKALCDRLATLLSDEIFGKTIKPPAAFWQRPFAGVAAAVVLIVSGVVLMQIGSPGSAQAMVVDPQLAQDLVIRHDACCNSHSSHQMAGVQRDDMAKLGETLSQKLHQPVLAAALPESGWSFRGGAICTVGKPNMRTGHLIFDQGKASISIFSMPREAYAQIGRYQTVVNNHAVAGFVDMRGTFCLVASGNSKITPEHLAALRDRMQADVVSAADTPSRMAVAELLH